MCVLQMEGLWLERTFCFFCGWSTMGAAVVAVEQAVELLTDSLDGEMRTGKGDVLSPSPYWMRAPQGFNDPGNGISRCVEQRHDSALGRGDGERDSAG